MKRKIIGYLNNLTTNEKNTFATTATITKNKYSYIIDNEKYTLRTLPNQLILTRDTNEAFITMPFILNKQTSVSYQIKEQDLTLEINILTNQIDITPNLIKINYTILDSSINYEYKIEMSD